MNIIYKKTANNLFNVVKASVKKNWKIVSKVRTYPLADTFNLSVYKQLMHLLSRMMSVRVLYVVE